MFGRRLDGRLTKREKEQLAAQASIQRQEAVAARMAETPQEVGFTDSSPWPIICEKHNWRPEWHGLQRPPASLCPDCIRETTTETRTFAEDDDPTARTELLEIKPEHDPRVRDPESMGRAKDAAARWETEQERRGRIFPKSLKERHAIDRLDAAHDQRWHRINHPPTVEDNLRERLRVRGSKARVSRAPTAPWVWSEDDHGYE